MTNVIKILVDLANTLDKSNLTKTADAVDAINNNILKITKAQYEGVMGYWARNGRCWQNCYRQKRVKTDLPAQEVWNECHEEYLKSFGKDKSDWDKYADEIPNLKKTADVSVAKIVSAEERRFHNGVKKSMGKGMDRPTAIFATINSNKERLSRYLIAQAQQVAKVATDLDYAGHKILANKTALAAAELAKYAQTEFAAPDPSRNTPGKTGLLRGLGRGVRDMTGWFGGEGKNLQNQIFNMMKYINYYSQNFQSSPQNAQQNMQQLRDAITNESVNLSQVAAQAKDINVKSKAQEAMQAINSFNSRANNDNLMDEINQLRISLGNVNAGISQINQQVEQGQENPYNRQLQNQPAAPSPVAEPAAEAPATAGQDQQQPEQPNQQYQQRKQDIDNAGGLEAVVSQAVKNMSPQELQNALDYVTEGGEFKIREKGQPVVAQASQREPLSLKTSAFLAVMEKIAAGMSIEEVAVKYKPDLMRWFLSEPDKNLLASYFNRAFRANNSTKEIVDKKGTTPGVSSAPPSQVTSIPSRSNVGTQSVTSVGEPAGETLQGVGYGPSDVQTETITSEFPPPPEKKRRRRTKKVNPQVEEAAPQAALGHETAEPEATSSQSTPELEEVKQIIDKSEGKPNKLSVKDMISNLGDILAETPQWSEINHLFDDFNDPKSGTSSEDYAELYDNIKNKAYEALGTRAAKTKSQIFKKAMSLSAKKSLRRLWKEF